MAHALTVKEKWKKRKNCCEQNKPAVVLGESVPFIQQEVH